MAPAIRASVHVAPRWTLRKETSDVDIHGEPALKFRHEPAVEPEELNPLPTDQALAEDSQQPAEHLEDAGNEVPDRWTDADDLSEVDMDRPLRVTFGKELRNAPTVTEFLRCQRHQDGTLQPIALLKVGPNTTYPSSLKETRRRVHRHYQCKDLPSMAVWAAAYQEDPRTRHIYKIAIRSPTA